MADEVDRFLISAGKEGDPLALAEQQEQNTLQTQLALAELAEVIVGADIDRG